MKVESRNQEPWGLTICPQRSGAEGKKKGLSLWRAEQRSGAEVGVVPVAHAMWCRSNHCIPEKPGLLLVVWRRAEL
ncbi:MAG: hypothetical protein GX581_02535 [Syntrophomonadaceae bacterium]|nr:hypothetical protein [Syntrophomonadaceae bacterium]